MRRHRVEICALVLVLWGCGGASLGGGPPALPPTAPPGVTPEVHALSVALERFAEAERDGWTDDRCRATSEAFAWPALHATAARSADAHFMDGLVRQRCGDPAGAARAYQRAISVQPSACRPRVAIGVLLDEGDHVDEAVAAFREAIRLDPRCGPAYTNLGALHRRAGRLDDALVDLRRGLAVDADDVVALNEMALALLARASADSRALDLAGVVCRQAQLIDPAFAPLYNTWALVDVRAGRLTTALAKLRRAVELDPRLFAAHMNLGSVTLSYRGYEDARAAFTAALELREDDYDALVGLGVALRGLGDPAAALEAYERARRAIPARPEAYFNLGLLHQDHLGGGLEALAEAERQLRAFLERADGAPAYADPIAQARTRLRNIALTREAVTAAGAGPAPTGEGS